MLSSLKDHPFAVEAFFESSLVLTFAIPKEEIQHLIPPCLRLDTFKDQYAFIAMAMVQTKSLRPKGFPAFMGNDFFLIGYRVFVKYTSSTGKKYRGLYILKSETNKYKMELLGNIFTHYNYTTTDIQQTKTDNQTTIKSVKSGFRIITEEPDKEISLPERSPFADWSEARKFAGPRPFTFTYNEKTKEVLIIEGVRQYWKPAPIKVTAYDISFIKDLPLSNPVLANAFVIRNIPYYWKKGKKEIWKD